MFPASLTSCLLLQRCCVSGTTDPPPLPCLLPQRTALCFADQFNGAQSNSYLVLTQTAGAQVVVTGVAVGSLVTGAALPLLLKQGGDVSCSLATVETLAADGAFDLSQVGAGRRGGG